MKNNTDYESVKSKILAAYSITTEGYRQIFCIMNKGDHQTYLEIASEKLWALQKWIKSTTVTTFD